MGFVISDEAIRPGKAKVQAIENYPVLKDIHEVRRFLGLTSFFADI